QRLFNLLVAVDFPCRAAVCISQPVNENTDQPTFKAKQQKLYQLVKADRKTVDRFNEDVIRQQCRQQRCQQPRKQPTKPRADQHRHEKHQKRRVGCRRNQKELHRQRQCYSKNRNCNLVKRWTFTHGDINRRVLPHFNPDSIIALIITVVVKLREVRVYVSRCNLACGSAYIESRTPPFSGGYIKFRSRHDRINATEIDKGASPCLHGGERGVTFHRVYGLKSKRCGRHLTTPSNSSYRTTGCCTGKDRLN